MPALDNIKHEQFALRVAAGENQSHAYAAVYKKRSPTACRSSSHTLVTKPDVAERIAELKRGSSGQNDLKCFLTKEEKRMALADIFRVDIGQFIDDKGRIDIKKMKKLPPWVLNKIEVHETTRTTKKGNTITNRRIKVDLVDRLRALDADNFLEGAEFGDQGKVEPEERPESQRRAIGVARQVLKELGYHGSKVIDV